jgi:hypothetical protein
MPLGAVAVHVGDRGIAGNAEKLDPQRRQDVVLPQAEAHCEEFLKVLGIPAIERFPKRIEHAVGTHRVAHRRGAGRHGVIGNASARQFFGQRRHANRAGVDADHAGQLEHFQDLGAGGAQADSLAHVAGHTGLYRWVAVTSRFRRISATSLGSSTSSACASRASATHPAIQPGSQSVSGSSSLPKHTGIAQRLACGKRLSCMVFEV